MSRKVAVSLLIFINTIWGSSWVVAKVALEELPPPLLAALRFTLATIVVGGVILSQTRPASKRGIGPVNREDGLKLIGLGIIGISFSYLLTYWGISMTTATDAVLLIVGEVIFTSFLAFLLLGERIGRWRGLGIIMGIIGVVILVLGNVVGDESTQSGLARAIGDVLILGGLLCQAVYSVLGAGLSRRYRPLTILFFTHAGSLLIWVPLLLWYIFSGQFPAISLMAALSVLYLAVATSVISFLIWFIVLRAVGANLGAVSLLIQPVVGAALGLLLLGDPLTVGVAIGAVFIFIALYLTTLPDRRRVTPEIISG